MTKLISRKTNGVYEQSQKMDLIELLAQDFKNMDDDVVEVLKLLAEVNDQMDEDFVSLGASVISLKQMVDLLCERLGVEIQKKPMVPEEYVLVDVKKKKK